MTLIAKLNVLKTAITEAIDAAVQETRVNDDAHQFFRARYDTELARLNERITRLEQRP